jgi:thymidylate synthase
MVKNLIGKIFVIGGAQVYETALKHPYLNCIYANEVFNSQSKLNNNVKTSYNCDKFFNFDKSKFDLVFEIKHYKDDKLTLRKYKVKLRNGEMQYLDALSELVELAENKNNFKHGRNGNVCTVNGRMFKFDLSSDVLPMLTTKKMYSKISIEENTFFNSGKTDTKILEKLGVNIWKGNTSKEFLKSRNLHLEEGDMGAMYGHNLRHFGEEYKSCDVDYSGKGVDQLQNVLDLLKNDPFSRRILTTTYNPAVVDEGVLLPCHGICTQYNVTTDGRLNCQMTQRSGDIFLGVPYNILSYSINVYLIACQNVTLTPGTLTIYVNDLHLYEEHLDAAKEQLRRIPYTFPTIAVKQTSMTKKIDEIHTEDLIISGYKSHNQIPAKMIA